MGPRSTGSGRFADLGKDSECKTIIRSPADTTVKNCGTPIYGGRGGLYFKANTKSTFMAQFCHGTGDCSAAGLKRDGGGRGSAIFYDASGDLIAPIAVGDGSED
ncbi:hypothetical protein NX059_008737 [Plenodomus lindquistii]|nr:hypothetical protein NX059_008737 [Plenodomus lindquistii]